MTLGRSDLIREICSIIVRSADEIAAAAAEPIVKAVQSTLEHEKARDIVHLTVATIVATRCAAVAAAMLDEAKN